MFLPYNVVALLCIAMCANVFKFHIWIPYEKKGDL